jgi:hypothetical protein
VTSLTPAPKPKRKYVRLSATQWAIIRAEWEIGELTLAELSGRHGVSERALQAHFAKHKVIKGAKAAALVAAVRQQIFEDDLQAPEVLAKRARETRESAYLNAVTIETLIMAQLEAAQKDPSLAIKAASAIKALSLAASGLERLHHLKRQALGLDKDPLADGELPQLLFEDLSLQEVDRIRRSQEEDDSENSDAAAVDDAGSSDSAADEVDDVVEERTDVLRVSEPALVRDSEGYRLVREADLNCTPSAPD